MKLKNLLPTPTKKKFLNFYRKIFWPIYFSQYKDKVKRKEKIDDKLLEKLIYTWGNVGYSAKIEYIKIMILYANNAQKLIFECGCGLSTLILGVIAKERNIKMISVEHIPFWAERVKNEIVKYNLSNNEIIVSNLINYGDFEWYERVNIDDKIDLVICDAPPASTFGGRKGFLYLYKDNIKSGSVILVDDTVRRAEKDMIKEWEGLMPMDISFKSPNDQHAVLVIK